MTEEESPAGACREDGAENIGTSGEELDLIGAAHHRGPIADR